MYFTSNSMSQAAFGTYNYTDNTHRCNMGSRMKYGIPPTSCITVSLVSVWGRMK